MIEEFAEMFVHSLCLFERSCEYADFDPWFEDEVEGGCECAEKCFAAATVCPDDAVCWVLVCLRVLEMGEGMGGMGGRGGGFEVGVFDVVERGRVCWEERCCWDVDVEDVS